MFFYKHRTVYKSHFLTQNLKTEAAIKARKERSRNTETTPAKRNKTVIISPYENDDPKTSLLADTLGE